MNYLDRPSRIVMVVCGLLLGTLASSASGESPRCSVEVEELVTSYQAANNGASPLWCYGSTVIARQDRNVFLSVIETGAGIPPLLNTRWQLWRRSDAGWRLLQTEKDFRQREPCPIAVFHNGAVFLSVNPSLEPAGATRGRCEPLILEFDPNDPKRPPIRHTPAWADGAHFTEHSYRGLAADGAAGELLLLNIDAKTGDQFLSYRDRGGRWSPKGKVAFPIRSCYPQVALRAHAAHILAIGDIVEPVEAWKKLKYERLKNDWDYVFRRLFYTYTADLRETPCRSPVEIDTVEETCGHILNLDLHIDEAGAAHVLYIKRLFQYDFIRDEYFAGRPMKTSLEYVVIQDGAVRLRATLAERIEDEDGLQPSFARFHVGGDSGLYVILAGAAVRGEDRAFGNFVGRIQNDGRLLGPSRVDLKHPFRNFFTNTPRAGSKPSEIADLFGTAGDDPNLRYARLRIEMNR